MNELTTPEPTRHANPTVKAQRLAYLVLERPDLAKAEAFLVAFGLDVAERTDDALYFRAATAVPFCYVVRRGPRARFASFAVEVEDRRALETLAKVEGASDVQPLATPGGGSVVYLTDPSGFRVEAVHGQAAYPAVPTRELLTANSGDRIQRVNGTQRPPVAPPDVLKLGHLVLELADYQATSGWYTRHLGLIPSDVQVLPDGSPAIAFMRFDRGSVPSDHHSLALAQGIAARFNHVAFETSDLDAIGMGQRVLREKGYDHAWGIGRHLLGSQIFDYWSDPWGDKHEHYCDGDVFTADVATNVSAASPDGLSQWGPPLPPTFVRPKASLANITDGIRNLARSPDLSLRKLRMLARMGG